MSAGCIIEPHSWRLLGYGRPDFHVVADPMSRFNLALVMRRRAPGRGGSRSSETGGRGGLGTKGDVVTTEPIGGPLTLRHASKRSSGTWGPDDYDVIDSRGRDIGRISKPRADIPPDHAWEW